MKAKADAAELARAGRELRPRDAGVRYTVVQQEGTNLYEVRRTDGKTTDGRYRGSWHAEQIVQMFEPVPTLDEDLAKFNAR
jgi:type IV secretory pathway protease TraF